MAVEDWASRRYNFTMAGDISSHQPRLLGLHHVTATADDAQADLNFCLDVLGLRLVKKTVNFDNHFVYHFYYGDALGRPGTLWTTFPYKGHGVRVGIKGAGQVTATAFSVPASSLDAWRRRLRARGIVFVEEDPRFGDDVIAFADASGLLFELIGASEDERAPWTDGGVGADAAVRGLHSVTLTVTAADVTATYLVQHLGFSADTAEVRRIRLSLNGGGPGRVLDVVHLPSAPAAVNGLGTVHHVALAIASAEEQLALREALLAAGTSVTEVRDRQYFTSIYFRVPGGVLFEVATTGPGFAVDEPVDALGRELKLPPWEEPHRAAIEAGLDVVHYRA
jgi:glyoxalase family protein